MKSYFTETLPVLFQLPNWSASELKVQRILQEGMALWSIETGWTRQGYSGIRKGTQFRGYKFFHCECLWRSCVTWGSLLWLQLPTEELRLHNDDLQQDGRSTMEDLQALLHSQTATTSVGPWRQSHWTSSWAGLLKYTSFWTTENDAKTQVIIFWNPDLPGIISFPLCANFTCWVPWFVPRGLDETQIVALRQEWSTE